MRRALQLDTAGATAARAAVWGPIATCRGIDVSVWAMSEGDVLAGAREEVAAEVVLRPSAGGRQSLDAINDNHRDESRKAP